MPVAERLLPVAAGPHSKELTRIFAYGLNQSRLRQAIRELSLPAALTEELSEANVVFTLRSYYRKRPSALSAAEQSGVPIYVLRSNTAMQMQKFLAELFGLQIEADPYALAMQEAEEAIERVSNGSDFVDLAPQNAFIRRRQHELARQANLLSRSTGKEPRRYVQIYHDQRPLA